MEFSYIYNVLKKGGNKMNDVLKASKLYFDPFIYQQLLENAWITQKEKEILFPWNFPYKQTLLFPEIKEQIREVAIKNQRFSDSVVEEEISDRLEAIWEYIGITDKDRQAWLDEIKEEFNLPDDYKFR